MTGAMIALLGAFILFVNTLRVTKRDFLDDHWTWKAAWLILTAIAIQAWSIVLIFIGAYYWAHGLSI